MPPDTADVFTREQLKQLETVVRKAVHTELNDAGIRVDGYDHREETRRDFMFLRQIRRGVSGAASKIGMAVLLAVLSGIVYLMIQGFKIFSVS